MEVAKLILLLEKVEMKTAQVYVQDGLSLISLGFVIVEHDMADDEVAVVLRPEWEEGRIKELRRGPMRG